MPILAPPRHFPTCGDITLIFNCRVLRQGKFVRSEVWLKDGKVVDPQCHSKANVTLDARNAIICAGWLDLQVNGAFGVDFLLEVNKAAGIAKCRKALLATGVTAFCPTLITADPKFYKDAIPFYPPVNGDGIDGAANLGCHCEGPFINTLKKGAHPEQFILDIDQGYESMKAVYGKENIEQLRIVTLAPEKTNSRTAIQGLVEAGVTVSLGHTMATLADCVDAVDAGARKITHLFNAMPAFHHRDPSVPGLLTTRGHDIFYGIISDSVHTHPTAVRLAAKMNGEGMILVTDAISAMGCGLGEFPLGEVTVSVVKPSENEPKRAYVKGTNTLGGAVATLDECVRYAADFLKSAEAALVAVSLTPARCIGMEATKGHLEPGADADFVVLDDGLNVLSTWVNGIEGYVAAGQESLREVKHEFI